MKKSSSKSGSKIFTTDEFSSRGQRFDRLHTKADEEDDNETSSAPNDVVEASDSVENDAKSPRSSHATNSVAPPNDNFSNVLMGSLVREEGHIYSIAASGELLLAGSDSKNIRVLKNQREYSKLESNSGSVKAIVISNGKTIFTGHQDGKIRVWKASSRNDKRYKQINTLPTLKNSVKCSMNASNYVEVRKNRKALWIKHYDAVSCLAVSEEGSLLYSASWDKSFKVWNVSGFECLESVKAHDDAVNALVLGFDGLVFTGSADGTVKVWRREMQGKVTKHFFSHTLSRQGCAAVTALVLSPEGEFVYCGASDGLVGFWWREDLWSRQGVLRGHGLAVLCLATAGSLVFSGSTDEGICVWKRSGREHVWLSVLTGHVGPVKCLAIVRHTESRDDNMDGCWILYSRSLDKSVKMWRVSEKVSVPTGRITMKSLS